MPQTSSSSIAISSIVWERLQIVPAKFSNETGIIGNAALAADAIKE